MGFPDMGYAYRVRNLRLEKLPDRVKFVELFDGRTLDGWQLRDGAIHEHVNSGFFLRGAPAGYRGSRCLVGTDGETASETGRLPAPAQGAGGIGLQIHKEDAAVEFRDPRVRPL